MFRRQRRKRGVEGGEHGNSGRCTSRDWQCHHCMHHTQTENTHLYCNQLVYGTSFIDRDRKQRALCVASCCGPVVRIPFHNDNAL